MFDGVMAFMCFALAFSYGMDAAREKDLHKGRLAIMWLIMWIWRVVEIVGIK